MAAYKLSGLGGIRNPRGRSKNVSDFLGNSGTLHSPRSHRRSNRLSCRCSGSWIWPIRLTAYQALLRSLHPRIGASCDPFSRLEAVVVVLAGFVGLKKYFYEMFT